MIDDLTRRLAEVKEKIAEAATRAERRPEDITLVAVSKTVEPARIRAAIEAGVRHLGENRVQEAAAKKDQVPSEGILWHLIGHLQSNKARLAVEIFDSIHSLDSIKLAERLDRIAGEMGKRLPVLIQVDLGKEPTKSGIDEAELIPLVERLTACANLELKGLMTLPPLFEDSQQARPFFRRLRQLLDQINQLHIYKHDLTELSMGMSHDYEVAIEEGATIVRVGTAIFGARNPINR